MQEVDLKVSKEYVEFIYSYLLKIEELDKDYTINRLSYLLKTNPIIMKDTLSFIEYKNLGMFDYIVEDLRDHIDTINNSKEKLEEISFIVDITNEDVDYFFESIKKSHKTYLPFIFDEHVKIALLNNQKALFALKAKTLANDAFFKSQLMGHIQYQLVGQQEPPSCAKNSVKTKYFEKFKDLKRKN